MKSLLSYIVGLFLRLRELISRIKSSRIGAVFVYCFPCFFLVVCCLFVDYALMLPQVYEHDVRRALVDNAGHGVIASISWWILVGKRTLRDKLEVLCCGILSSAVDVDHFISAGSLELKEALHLHHRPFLHNTSLVLLAVPAVQVWVVQTLPSLHSLPFIFTVALMTHHLRDASRRGLWFWPFGSTPRLQHGLYIVLILILIGLVKDARAAVQRLPNVSNTKRTMRRNVVHNV